MPWEPRVVLPAQAGRSFFDLHGVPLEEREPASAAWQERERSGRCEVAPAPGS